MRLTILGGGGFRVPLVHRALLADREQTGITELVLHDVDAGRLDAIGRVLTAQARGVPGAPRLITTTDLDTAVTRADFVFCAVRVGGLRGRVTDERVALEAGVLGQETVGAGGISYGLRTVPEARRIAARIARLAPAAWTINFTNPAGLVTEAMATHLGDRVIGICDSPSGLVDRVLKALGADPGTVRVDYAGLNHLGWLYGVHLLDAADPRAAVPLGAGARRTGAGLPGVPGSARGTGAPGPAGPGADGDGNLLARLLADRPRLESFEEGRLFGADRLRDLGAIPNEYLHYYYDPAGTLAAVRQAAQTRGEFLLGQQRRCYAEILVRDPLGAWLGAWREREATYMAENRELTGAGEREHDESRPAGYEGVALAVMRALAHDEPTTLILNVRNRGAVAALDDGAVVEVPCTVDARGASPQRISPLPAHGTGLIQAVKTAERWVLQAVDSGSKAAAVRAMAEHPLVGSEPVAARLIDAYRAEFPELAYLRAG
ncbi:6-phospho-beta-glucosidase [Actinoplanes lobatus]|uniref:6-phospho-beta-glucosidase n=1 Tax=Actinoplanes lobatus TaxID=113568 RepID=A0A7W7MLF2_9ACTN|nr:6-phospho-beta-glucosidase [Actinoplanes lobatus]MBB4754802.1 6-phospho-beta-glucosidase [Actinoplanes lobatus]GGN81728.1 6-phospho-beta-glucosidase [Actinoplanes lobatus]GIE43067.1 6-phospho-beta-glucosidase [Actinoplanes lobatus]